MFEYQLYASGNSFYQVHFELEAGKTTLEVFCKEIVPVIGCLNFFCCTKTRLEVVVAGVGADFIAEGLMMLTELVVATAAT